MVDAHEIQPAIAIKVGGTEGKAEVHLAGGIGYRHLTDTVIHLVAEEAGAVSKAHQTLRRTWQESQVQISILGSNQWIQICT